MSNVTLRFFFEHLAGSGVWGQTGKPEQEQVQSPVGAVECAMA